MITEKWALIQPTHVDRRLLAPDSGWSNDSFNNISRLFQARVYHTTDPEIDETADVYWNINLNMAYIDKEINFLTKMKDKGKKIVVGFSQDTRFMIGNDLINDQGYIYTDLCKVADVIGGGINPDLEMFGRYQHKVVDMGEILEPLNFSIPYEDRNIDLLISGELNGKTLPFELEFASMIYEKYPNTKITICVPDYVTFKESVIKKYPHFSFPSSEKITFLNCMRDSKVYLNLECRPRGGRTLIEAYYCRTPFIACVNNYHTNLCKESSYTFNDLGEMVGGYERLLYSNHKKNIEIMEERALNDYFEPVYNRMKTKLGLN